MIYFDASDEAYGIKHSGKFCQTICWSLNYFCAFPQIESLAQIIAPQYDNSIIKSWWPIKYLKIRILYLEIRFSETFIKVYQLTLLVHFCRLTTPATRCSWVFHLHYSWNLQYCVLHPRTSSVTHSCFLSFSTTDTASMSPITVIFLSFMSNKIW